MAVKGRSKETRRAPMGVAANEAPRSVRGRTASPETPLALRTRGVEADDELREYIAKRAGFKLGKFAPAIERTSVRLEDIAGPKGAPAIRCAVKVVLPRQGSVVVEVIDADARAAFDHCIDAVERAVRRTLDKTKTKARRRDS